MAEGTQAFMFETSLQLAVTKVIFSSISVTHFMQSSNKKKSITNMVFTVGGGDLSEVGPCLLRVLATTQEQLPPMIHYPQGDWGPACIRPISMQGLG